MRACVFSRFGLIVGSIFSLSASVAASPSPARQATLPGDSLAVYADLVKETELRRRVNVLYPNPQSIFDGLQVGYVGVRHGNLTFLRRDIISGANNLGHFSRVYDSRIRRGRDFGPGWRLSLSEELTVADGGLVYIDGSGARHLFQLGPSTERGARRERLSTEQVQLSGDGTRAQSSQGLASGVYKVSRATPQHAMTTIEINGPIAVLSNGKVTRIFERSLPNAQGSSAYRLSRIAFSEDDWLALSYRNGLISAVSDAAGVVFIVRRDSFGRIGSVQDRWGREVLYRYDASGFLLEVQDIAGNIWRYEYEPGGRLIRAIGPNGRDILRIRYDVSGRVKESLSGRQYSFSYAQDETIVVEGTGHSHVVGHNAAGITDRFDSTNGVWWRLTLDDRNRVVEAYSSNGAYQYGYDLNGHITRVRNQLHDSSNAREFQYDAEGRITRIYSDDGAFTAVDYAGGFTRISGPEDAFAFDVLPSGKVALAGFDGTFISADYDAGGALIAFRNGASVVEFGRDSLGRVSHIQHGNGEVNHYDYDELGNRASVHYGMGGAVRYAHDPSGNIVEVVVRERNGEQKKQLVQIGDMNRVESIEYEGAGTLDIAYDRMGRAVRFEMGGEVVSVEYQSPDRISRIVSESTGAIWSPQDEGSVGTRTVTDARLQVLHRDAVGASQPDYGIVGFDEATFSLFARSPMELGVPGLLEARQLFAVAEPLFVEDEYEAMMNFEKPSNPVFQPLEYRSTNCCIVIIVVPQWELDPCDPAGPDDPPVWCYCQPSPPPAPPEISITTDSTTVWFIDKYRNMPAITLQAALENVGDPSGLTYTWELKARYKGDVESVTESTKSNRWTPEWDDRIFGGDVTVSVSVQIDGSTLSDSRSGYKIHGRNPDKSQLASYVESPWFFSQLIREESSCLHFYPSAGGEVHVSADNGYGFTQLTNPAPTVKQKWDWLANVSEGKRRLNGMKPTAQSWWSDQKKQWEAYNAMQRQKGRPEVPDPPDRTYGKVTFGYSGSGKKSLVDGIWIQLYNGSPDGMWLAWKNDGEAQNNPYWKYNDTGYVGRVAGSTKCH